MRKILCMKCTMKFCMRMKLIDIISCKGMEANIDNILKVFLQHFDRWIRKKNQDECRSVSLFSYLMQFMTCLELSKKWLPLCLE